jgi:hypothetical protein
MECIDRVDAIKKRPESMMGESLRTLPGLDYLE